MPTHRRKKTAADRARLQAKIRILIDEGYPPNQAVAIAYRMLDFGRRKLETRPQAFNEPYDPDTAFAYFPYWWESEKLSAPPNPDLEQRYSHAIGPFTSKERQAIYDAGGNSTSLLIQETGDPNWAEHGSMPRKGQGGHVIEGYRRGKWNAINLTTSEIIQFADEEREEAAGIPGEPFHLKTEIRPKRGRPVGSPYREPPLTAYEAQQRRRKGATVNERMDPPKSPCEEVDGEICTVCGEYYKMVKLGANDIGAASRMVRRSAGGWEAGGGYRSRGPLLWAMHLIKLERWYERHLDHCVMVQIAEEDSAIGFVPIPPAVVWAESFGSSRLQKLAADWYEARDLEQRDEPFRDWIAQPMAPAEYSRKMQRILARIRSLLTTRTQKQRERLELPSRREQGKEWEAKANQILTREEEDTGDYPF